MVSFYKMIRISCLLSLMLISCENKSALEQKKTKEKSQEEEIHDIDKEIKEKVQQLAEYRLKVFNREMQAQDQMLDEWKGFSEKIKDSEQYEEFVVKIEKRIHELQERKQVLLKQQNAGKK